MAQRSAFAQAELEQAWLELLKNVISRQSLVVLRPYSIFQNFFSQRGESIDYRQVNKILAWMEEEGWISRPLQGLERIDLHAEVPPDHLNEEIDRIFALLDAQEEKRGQARSNSSVSTPTTVQAEGGFSASPHRKARRHRPVKRPHFSNALILACIKVLINVANKHDGWIQNPLEELRATLREYHVDPRRDKGVLAKLKREHYIRGKDAVKLLPRAYERYAQALSTQASIAQEVLPAFEPLTQAVYCAKDFSPIASYSQLQLVDRDCLKVLVRLHERVDGRTLWGFSVVLEVTLSRHRLPRHHLSQVLKRLAAAHLISQQGRGVNVLPAAQMFLDMGTLP